MNFYFSANPTVTLLPWIIYVYLKDEYERLLFKPVNVVRVCFSTAHRRRLALGCCSVQCDVITPVTLSMICIRLCIDNTAVALTFREIWESTEYFDEILIIYFKKNINATN